VLTVRQWKSRLRQRKGERARSNAKSEPVNRRIKEKRSADAKRS
jgi:hypothetical protein